MNRGRIYDIVEKITSGNTKPTLRIDADHEFTINTSKNTAVYIKALSEDDKIEEFERIDKIIGAALGKEALDYIDSLELTLNSYMPILNAIMAAISDMSLEEMEEFADKKKSPRGKKQ